MKPALILSLGALLWVLPQQHARAVTSAELLKSCEAVVNNAAPASEGTVDIPRAGLRCWYYMSAVQNMSVLVDPSGKRLLSVCAPPETTLLDYVRVFVRYAHRKPEAATDNAAAGAVSGLSEAFPCNRE